MMSDRVRLNPPMGTGSDESVRVYATRPETDTREPRTEAGRALPCQWIDPLTGGSCGMGPDSPAHGTGATHDYMARDRRNRDRRAEDEADPTRHPSRRGMRLIRSESAGTLDDRTRLAAKIADRIAAAYRTERFAMVAEACDETLDRSGNLLGWLREYARLTEAER